MDQIACAYCRVSSTDQARDGWSLTSQEETIRKYCQDQKLTLDKLYVEVYSSKEGNKRPKFNSLLLYLKSHPTIKHAVFPSYDRASRNFFDVCRLQDLVGQGITLHFIRDKSTLSKDSPPSQTLMADINWAMAKWYLSNLSASIKSGTAVKVKGGGYPHETPIGYINSKETRTVEIDPETAPVIKKVFDLAATHQFTLRGLWQEAYKIGLRSKRTKKKIPFQSFLKLLRNPFFTGQFYWGKVLYTGVHEPVINKAIWDDVQEYYFVSGQNGKFQTGRSRKLSNDTHLFSGLIKCKLAGRTMSWEMHKGKFLYCKCQQYIKCPHRNTCETHKAGYIKFHEIELQVLQKLASLESIPEDIDLKFKNFFPTLQKDLVKTEKEIELIKRQIKTKESLMDGLLEEKLEGRCSEEQYIRLKNKYMADVSDMQERLQNFRKIDPQQVTDFLTLLKNLRNFGTFYLRLEPGQKRTVVTTVISNLVLNGKKLDVAIKSPFLEWTSESWWS